MQPLPPHHQLRRVASSGHRAQGMQKQSKSCHLPATPLNGKQWRHHQHRSVLPTSLLRLESLNVSLESLLFDQAGLDSKLNNSTSATGTIHSTDTTVSTTSCASAAGDKQQARQLVDCLKSIDTAMLKERKIRYRISCSFRALDNNCKSLFNFLRGKGSNAVGSTAEALPKDIKNSCTTSTAMVAHEPQQPNGLRMLLNRKLLTEPGDNVPLTTCQNVVIDP